MVSRALRVDPAEAQERRARIAEDARILVRAEQVRAVTVGANDCLAGLRRAAGRDECRAHVERRTAWLVAWLAWVRKEVSLALGSHRRAIVASAMAFVGSDA
jgi:hypothetical protein